MCTTENLISKLEVICCSLKRQKSVCLYGEWKMGQSDSALIRIVCPATYMNQADPARRGIDLQHSVNAAKLARSASLGHTANRCLAFSKEPAFTLKTSDGSPTWICIAFVSRRTDPPPASHTDKNYARTTHQHSTSTVSFAFNERSSCISSSM